MGDCSLAALLFKLVPDLRPAAVGGFETIVFVDHRGLGKGVNCSQSAS